VELDALGALVWGGPALVLVMGAAWVLQLRTRVAGIVDLLWTLGLGALALWYACQLQGWPPRRIAVALGVLAWSLRLGAHLWRRLALEGEDGRYRDLRRRLGDRADLWFLLFFQAQALLAVALSAVFLVPMDARMEGWRWNDAAALAVWALALAGETVADRQLAAWRRDPARRGRTCRAGLWRLSRHPNYFFEWLHWLSYPLLSLGLPWGWATWLAPLAMLGLVLRVTGIPPSEARALETRGDDYRDYQRTTRAFVPWPLNR